MTTPDLPPERRALRPRRGDVAGRARWLAARGRNALRHRSRFAVLGTVIFVGMLVFLVLLPGKTRTMRAGLVLREGVQDTTPLVAAYGRADREYQQLDSLLREVRARLTTPPPTAAVRLTPTQRWKRDSLTDVARVLGRLITRVENSPLPQTYRAIAGSPLLRNDAQVQQLLDSLTAIEREREGFGAVGGVDPMFVALTSRATALGRAIQGIAEAQRTVALDEIERINQAASDTAIQVAQASRDSAALANAVTDSTGLAIAAPVVPAVGMPVVDTIPFRARTDTAGILRERAASALSIARTFNADLERRAREARDEANILAPPLAILIAALLLGLSVGFAFSLLLEVTRPAVSDPAEVERITGVRVLGVVRPGERADERDRRQVDLLAPPDLEPGSRAYRAIFLHLIASGSTARTVTVMGDDPAIAAAVAANIAYIAATEARNTLLVDTDTKACGVSSILHLRPSPGTAEVLARRAGWSEVITTPAIGRDRTLDVVTAGGRDITGMGLTGLDHVRDELARIARRYDFCVISAPENALDAAEHALLPLTDVLLCVRVARTSISSLAALNESARQAGIRLRGIVLWRGESPALHSREEQLVAATTATPTSEDRDVPALAG